ncbi:hypothetical protein PMZ80_002537 [Knufia obscura]|uniref:Uncharacterized protein n=2 Tax=Knufia TaxID=430999 RepID=A0AAN8ECA3_9EURO|nr:hypothetical protein PMZ80_002537 [Knufia obscura]KAK5950755.1 hypothetical protein OHC33_008138 [Knufia fluminis]
MLFTFFHSVKHALGLVFEFWHEETEQGFRAQDLTNSPLESPSNEDASDNVQICRQTYSSFMDLLQLHAYSIGWRRTEVPKAAAVEERRNRIMQIHNKICEVRSGVKRVDSSEKEVMLHLLEKHMDTIGPALKVLSEQIELLHRAEAELGASQDQTTLALASRLEIARTLPQRLHHLESDLTVKAGPLSEGQISRIKEEIQEVQQAILQSYNKPLEGEYSEELVELEQSARE